MELNEFLAHLDAHLDPDSEQSVLAITPQLQALGRNRRFLAEFLASNLDRPDFQCDNSYSGATIIVGRGEGYTVRVVAWPPASEIHRMGSGREPHLYREDEPDPIAHTHPFGLLTYGFLGPGYTTEVYGCDPVELIRRGVGEAVSVGPAQWERLEEGAVLFYPAFRVAHIQHPPAEYSVSLNLMVHPSNPRGFEQYFVSPRRGVLTGVAGTETESAVAVLEMVRRLPSGQTCALLERVARAHRLRTVRERAGAILRHHTHEASGAGGARGETRAI